MPLSPAPRYHPASRPPKASALSYDLVIFDFDGTLADSARWFAGVLNGVAARYGFRQLSEAEFAMLRGRDNREIVRYLGVPGWKLPFIANHMRGLMTRDAGLIRPFPGTPDLLRTLAGRGVRIAVVTSNTEANVRRILGSETAALIGRYACGVGLFGKAAKFRAVVKAEAVPPARVLCIGDEARDIEAARDAGLDSAAVSWGYAAPDLLRSLGPTLFFERMEEIPDAIRP
ncbi:MAG TPA: HAD hydrolase-like protein [Azospirillaceae bacterium]|nr:HAD hydrolase-like protein [Azospirillaceae bacterium]